MGYCPLRMKFNSCEMKYLTRSLLHLKKKTRILGWVVELEKKEVCST